MSVDDVKDLCLRLWTKNLTLYKTLSKQKKHFPKHLQVASSFSVLFSDCLHFPLCLYLIHAFLWQIPNRHISQLLPGVQAAPLMDGCLFESVSFLSEGRCYIHHLIAAFWITGKWIAVKIHRVAQTVIAKLSTCVLPQMGDCKTPCERFKRVPLHGNTTCYEKNEQGSLECTTLTAFSFYHKLFSWWGEVRMRECLWTLCMASW